MTAATGVRWQAGDSIKGEQKAGDGESRERFWEIQGAGFTYERRGLEPRDTRQALLCGLPQGTVALSTA